MSQAERSAPAGIDRAILMTLFARATESARPDALLRDQRAEELVQQIPYEWSRIQLDEGDLVRLALRGREFDRLCRRFMEAEPAGCVVHIGCGMDTRFQRIDNGQVLWYDLDLPQVIEERRQWIGGEQARYRMLSSSVLDEDWMDTLSAQQCASTLFVAEGVLGYLRPEQVRWLVQMLLRRFPGSELLCDVLSPWLQWLTNLQLWLSGSTAKSRWAVRSPEEVESWGEGIRLLERLYYLNLDEPRLTSHRDAIRVPFLARGPGIYRFRLGPPPEAA